MNITKMPKPVVATALGLVMSVAAGNLYADHHGAKHDVEAASQHTVAELETMKHEMQRDASHEKQEFTGAAKNAWQHGKLETALLLNRHLSNFSIDSRVEEGVATLYGTVESDVDLELAKQVAMSIDGINTVNSELKVDRENVSRRSQSTDNNPENRSFAQVISDATTTAAVKTKLLANGETEGFDINVDTLYSAVTLRGEVDSAEEKMLAEKIASNTDDVRSVSNQLIIETDNDRTEEAE